MDHRASYLTLMATLLIALTALPAAALSSGSDVIVPAAARAGTWITDLYIFNPGPLSASFTVFWLVRAQANPNPIGTDYTLAPGAVLALEDAIKEVFGFEQAGGAFRVLSDQPVVVSSRIYNLQDGVTFGQGFDGIPRSMAITAGSGTDMLAVSNNTRFRTNLVVMDSSGTGATVELSLRDASGAELASATYSLGAFEAVLDPISKLDGVTELDNGTLHAEVTSGAAIISASKIDNDPDTGDPTTLAAWTSAVACEPTSDGTYQLAIYDDSGYATGGYLVLAGSQVSEIDVTYSNWDKGEVGDPDCTLTFRWQATESGVHLLSEYANGVTFDQHFADGSITWTVTMDLVDAQSISGTVEAYGSGFSGILSGCNGGFPPLDLHAGVATDPAKSLIRTGTGAS